MVSETGEKNIKSRDKYSLPPKEFVEYLRRSLFGEGIDWSMVADDVRDYYEKNEAFKKKAARLAKEINTKETHFILELIQNAEDNKYSVGVEPYIKFILRDNYLLVQNNERGFSHKDVEALCDVGGSNKTRREGYIGEKGIGFKSVFTVADEVRIYSNGFQFGFKYDKNDPVSLIKPDWFDDVPDFVDTEVTNIVLYLRENSLSKIKNYLEDISPQLILFLKKIKRIEVLIGEEKHIVIEKKAHSNNVIELVKKSVGPDRSKTESSLWKIVKKKFEVPNEISSNEPRREGVTTTEIILAFPLLDDGKPDVSKYQHTFAFLPIGNFGFKFIIQADFILTINREGVLHNEWNIWIRDRIVETFLWAVDKKFRKEQFMFYGYIPKDDEVRDDFFRPLVRQIIELLKNTNFILTASERWKSPANVFVPDDKIKELITNDDVRHVFKGKEYVHDDVLPYKDVLEIFEVQKFDKDMLLEALKDEKWLIKKIKRPKERKSNKRRKREGNKNKKRNNINVDWVVKLYTYFRDFTDDEDVKKIKNMQIIVLEDRSLASPSRIEIYFPFSGPKRKTKKKSKKKRYLKTRYSFEGSLDKFGVLNSDVYLKLYNEDSKTIEFLEEKLGVLKANPKNFIENTILPIYENSEYEEYDDEILYDFVRYIKDNLKAIENEKKGNQTEKKDTLLGRIKQYIVLKTTSGEYKHPGEIYFSKRGYGNKYNLENLLAGADDVYFLSDEYFKKDPKYKKKDRKKRKSVKEEWIKFFEKLGVWHTIRVCVDPDTKLRPGVTPKWGGSFYSYESPTSKFVTKYNIKYALWGKYEKWINTESTYNKPSGYYIRDDWISPHFEYLFNKISDPNTPRDIKIEIAKAILNQLDDGWERYKNCLEATYYYHPYGGGWNPAPTKSTFYLMLLHTPWVYTTTGEFRNPPEVFIDSKELREFMGNDVPYLVGKVKSEELIETLKFKKEATVYAVLRYLKELVERKKDDIEKFKRIYKKLSSYKEQEDLTKIKEFFKKNPVIFIPDTDKKYFTSKEVIWKKDKTIDGYWGFVAQHYGGLRDFFVDMLKVSEEATTYHYAKTLIMMRNLNTEPNSNNIFKIYKKINDSIRSIENKDSKPEWWEKWKEIEKKIPVWTNKGWRRVWYDECVFINDAEDICDVFNDYDDIACLELPKTASIGDLLKFIDYFEIPYLSKAVKMTIINESDFEDDATWAEKIRKSVVYLARYLYHKHKKMYDKKFEILQKFACVNTKTGEALFIQMKLCNNTEESRNHVAHYDEKNNTFYINISDGNEIKVLFSLASKMADMFEVSGLLDFIVTILEGNKDKINIRLSIEDVRELPLSEYKRLRQCSAEEEQPNEIKRDELEIEELTPPSSEQVGIEIEEIVLLKGRVENNTEEEIVEKTSSSGLVAEEPPAQSQDQNIGEGHISNDEETNVKGGEVPVADETFKEEGQTPDESEESSPRSEDTKPPSEGTPTQPQGDYEPTRRRHGHSQRDTSRNKDIGRIAEKIAFQYLQKQHKNGKVVWMNENGESGNPYDIVIYDNSGNKTYVEVKGTTQCPNLQEDEIEDEIEFTKNEFEFMKENNDKYMVYRVYCIGSTAVILNINNVYDSIKNNMLKVEPTHYKIYGKFKIMERKKI